MENVPSWGFCSHPCCSGRMQLSTSSQAFLKSSRHCFPVEPPNSTLPQDTLADCLGSFAEELLTSACLLSWLAIPQMRSELAPAAPDLGSCLIAGTGTVHFLVDRVFWTYRRRVGRLEYDCSLCSGCRACHFLRQ